MSYYTNNIPPVLNHQDLNRYYPSDLVDADVAASPCTTTQWHDPVPDYTSSRIALPLSTESVDPNCCSIQSVYSVHPASVKRSDVIDPELAVQTVRSNVCKHRTTNEDAKLDNRASATNWGVSSAIYAPANHDLINESRVVPFLGSAVWGQAYWNQFAVLTHNNPTPVGVPFNSSLGLEYWDLQHPSSLASFLSPNLNGAQRSKYTSHGVTDSTIGTSSKPESGEQASFIRGFEQGNSNVYSGHGSKCDDDFKADDLPIPWPNALNLTPGFLPSSSQLLTNSTKVFDQPDRSSRSVPSQWTNGTQTFACATNNEDVRIANGINQEDLKAFENTSCGLKHPDKGNSVDTESRSRFQQVTGSLELGESADCRKGEHLVTNCDGIQGDTPVASAVTQENYSVRDILCIDIQDRNTSTFTGYCQSYEHCSTRLTIVLSSKSIYSTHSVGHFPEGLRDWIRHIPGVNSDYGPDIVRFLLPLRLLFDPLCMCPYKCNNERHNALGKRATLGLRGSNLLSYEKKYLDERVKDVHSEVEAYRIGGQMFSQSLSKLTASVYMLKRFDVNDGDQNRRAKFRKLERSVQPVSRSNPPELQLMVVPETTSTFEPDGSLKHNKKEQQSDQFAHAIYDSKEVLRQSSDRIKSDDYPGVDGGSPVPQAPIYQSLLNKSESTEAIHGSASIAPPNSSDGSAMYLQSFSDADYTHSPINALTQHWTTSPAHLLANKLTFGSLTSNQLDDAYHGSNEDPFVVGVHPLHRLSQTCMQVDKLLGQNLSEISGSKVDRRRSHLRRTETEQSERTRDYQANEAYNHGSPVFNMHILILKRTIISFFQRFNTNNSPSNLTLQVAKTIQYMRIN
ncbi:hypothetical protein X801_01572 [Opisthorchis viverrini]|uniref:Uncharacterized protein n=1 Tax=Opisthorchis viverrini TaxID=6198 RepID=A0A1S8X752_OPIVI|nr:hypothetical protein X801_01572 [Opisthorchis viverrini]